ncbi:hypothetical protein AOA59_29490 [Pseudomonas sp. 2822-15]|uniref:hypothetical protein n=1 Tax=Pseudomonas sp. 2822-15 TaxID=1712677 RepID=UPI000C15EA6E|nr:hypothetical protein [Pseudomonas sp. 2822-15]PIB40623.1 hypothetical protein AOA59_29490 [Pseudomonas sp. 2822-15]
MNKIRAIDIKTKKKINPNGSMRVEFIYKNKSCQVLEIKGKKADICSNNQTMIKDFENIIRTLKVAIKINMNVLTDPHVIEEFDNANDLHIISNSLFISSVVTYCKCATPSNARKEKNTHSTHILEKLTPEQIATHNTIKKLRDKWAAHTDKNQIESSKTLFVFDPEGKLEPTFIHHTSYGASIIISQLEEFLLLAETSIEILISKQKKDSADLFKTELKNFNFLEEVKKISNSLTYHEP